MKQLIVVPDLENQRGAVVWSEEIEPGQFKILEEPNVPGYGKGDIVQATGREARGLPVVTKKDN